MSRHPGRPFERQSFEEGHARAELGGLAGTLAAGAVIVSLGACRAISRRLCIGALVTCMLFPYWLFPGFGLVIIAAVLTTRRVQRELALPTPDPVAPR